MQIETVYPDKSLMPNRKNGKHWAATKDAKKAQFSQGYYSTRFAKGWRNFPESDFYRLHIEYVQPDKRHRDLDNLLAASKPMLDGVAKALGVDDKQFKPITIDRVHGDEFKTLITINEVIK